MAIGAKGTTIVDKKYPEVMDKSEVADFFRISVSSVNAMMADHVIRSIPKVPGVRFPTAKIMELKDSGWETEDIKPLSSRERMELKREIRQQKEIIDGLNKTIGKMQAVMKSISREIILFTTEPANEK